jgi:hypothetical protein
LYVDAGVGLRGKNFARAIVLVSLHSEDESSCGGKPGKLFRYVTMVALKPLLPFAGEGRDEGAQAHHTASLAVG